MSKDRARLLEQNRIDSINAWGRGLVEAAKNTPISIAEAGIGTGSGGAYNPEPPPPPPGPDGFTSRWIIGTPGETISLPYQSDGVYTGTIYWGDGTTSVNSYANRQHEFATPGNYTIIIEGQIIGFSFNNPGVNPVMAPKLLDITKWSGINFGNSGAYFSGCTELTITATDTPDFSGTTSLQSMFEGCTSLTDIPGITSWPMYSVTDMSGMFMGATSFNQELSGLYVNAVTDMTDMFNGAIAFNGILYWDVSSLSEARRMFYGATSFEGYGLEGWTTSLLVDASYMFTGCSSFNGQIGQWVTSNVTNMGYMLSGATGFMQEQLYWDTSNVEDMSGMFQDAYLTNIDLTPGNLNEYWDTSNVTTMANMFYNGLSRGRAALVGLENWNVSSVTDMSYMFAGCSTFRANLGNWFRGGRTASVRNMNSMFENCFTFNSDISGWNITSLQTAIGFMAGKTTADYDYLDNIYTDWYTFIENNGVPLSVVIDFGDIQYTGGGSAAAGRGRLESRFGWTITDGGEI